MILFYKDFEGIRKLEASKKTNDTKSRKLNLFEPFIGRLEFNKFFKLFNFESNIYIDKQFKYSIISNFNKRIIPEFVSTWFAHLTYNNIIDKEIRKTIEQYLIAIMSNMDYWNFADIGQIYSNNKYSFNNKNKGKIKKNNSFLYIIGSCPKNFDDDDYRQALSERIKATEWLFERDLFKKQNINYTQLFCRDLEIVKKSIGLEKLFEKIHIRYELNEASTNEKLTKTNINQIFKSLKTAKIENSYTDPKYNLIIVGSSFQIPKIALEIEKYLYEFHDFKKDISSILLIGNEKIYNLFNYNNKESKFQIKKIQSFMFEIFMHSLDRNKFK